jgi:hypothetical protein
VTDKVAVSTALVRDEGTWIKKTGMVEKEETT